MEILNEDKKIIGIGLLSNGNHSEDSAENTSQSHNNNRNNIFNVITNILYPNKEQKELILYKLEKSLELLSKIEKAKINYESINVKIKEEEKRKIYDINFLFLEWKNAFKIGYRTDLTFKKLIQLQDDITLESIKNNLASLVPNLKIEIFKEDFHNFAKSIPDVLSNEEIDSYNDE